MKKNAVHTFLMMPLFMGFVMFARAGQADFPLNSFGIDDALIGNPAPQLDIVEWLNGDGITLNDVRGNVVVLEFFQLWCPGCNKFSIPLMKEWTEKFEGEDDILFVSIHTVFEGHQVQSPARLKKFVEKKKIQHLVGIDRHIDNDPVPSTMHRYRTGGTPCMVIVDKNGLIRFKYMGGFRAEPVTALIKDLLNEHVSITEEKSGPF